MQRLPPPGFFLRSPPRSPARSPPRMPPQAFRQRSRSPPPSRPPPAYARSASQPRPRPLPSSPPPFYRLAPPPPQPPPHSPSRSYSQARRSPPRFRASARRSPPPSPPRSRAEWHEPPRSRSEWREPPPSASATGFQRGKSLARDNFRPPPDRPEPAQWRAKQQQQSPSPALAQRVMSLSAFCGEVLDARGRLLPSSQRPRSPGLSIPVPLLRGESPKQYELAFRDWLLRRKNLLVDDLRADAAKERAFRFSFAYSRLPMSAWEKPAPPASSNHRLEPSATRSDLRDSSRPSRGLTADSMPPRAKPFKRSLSVDPKKDVRIQPEVEAEPKTKRPRRASPRDPRVRHANSDATGNASTTVAPTSGRLETESGEDIDGEPMSDLEAAQMRTSMSGSAFTPSTNQANGTAGAISEPQTRPLTETTPVAASLAKESPHSPRKAVDATDEVLPKWATTLLQRVQDLEEEVRDLRRQLAAHGPDGAFKDGVGETDLIKVDRVDISTEEQLADKPSDGGAPRTASDPVKMRLAAAYNDLNDEILLNEDAVAESDRYVCRMMATDERQARELQGQIQELRAAIELQKSKRDASLAELVAHCWKGRREALEKLLAAPLKPQDAADIQQASHAKCARLAAQAKLQDRGLAESGSESTAEDMRGDRRRARAREAARNRLEREQEAEYAVLLTASERVRDMVHSLLDAPP